MSHAGLRSRAKRLGVGDRGWDEPELAPVHANLFTVRFENAVCDFLVVVVMLFLPSMDGGDGQLEGVRGEGGWWARALLLAWCILGHPQGPGPTDI